MNGKVAQTEFDHIMLRSLREGKKQQFLTLVKELHPYDLANLYGRLPEQYRTRFLSFLPIKQTASFVQELEQTLQVEVLTKLGPDKSAQVLNLMDNDDLAVLLREVSEEEKQRFLSGMEIEESQAVRNLMQYPPETAGGIMTNRYVWIPRHYTVRDVMAKLREFAELAETIHYLFVIDEEKKLVGVLSYRDLILAEPEEEIEHIMYERVISVNVEDDQEEVARVIARYDFLAVPVVERDNRLVGIITVDDIIDVVIQEATEDIEKLSASGKDIDFDTKATVAAYRRLPWLVLLLLIGIISGSIISVFENTLANVVALAFFMPMIAGMTGNTGTQSLAVVVRGLSTQEVSTSTVMKLLIRELLVGMMLGVICGVLITLVAFFWQGSMMLGIVVGSSLSITLVIGTLSGTFIPILLYKLKVDPAIASGPLITTLNDILSLLIYFSIASLFMSSLM